MRRSASPSPNPRSATELEEEGREGTRKGAGPLGLLGGQLGAHARPPTQRRGGGFGGPAGSASIGGAEQCASHHAPWAPTSGWLWLWPVGAAAVGAAPRLGSGQLAREGARPRARACAARLVCGTWPGWCGTGPGRCRTGPSLFRTGPGQLAREGALPGRRARAARLVPHVARSAPHVAAPVGPTGLCGPSSPDGLWVWVVQSRWTVGVRCPVQMNCGLSIQSSPWVSLADAHGKAF